VPCCCLSVICLLCSLNLLSNRFSSLPLKVLVTFVLTWNSLRDPRGKNITARYHFHSFVMASENPSMKLDPKYDHYDYPTTSPNQQSGHPGHTTPEQDAQVYQLRMKLEADGYTERLDTLTLVRAQNQLHLLCLADARRSCDSCEHENSMWPFQRRCRLFRLPSINYLF
jgi:hypothetical protein